MNSNPRQTCDVMELVQKPIQESESRVLLCDSDGENTIKP